MSFGANEEVSYRVPAYGCTEVSHKMIAAGVVGASGETAIEKGLVKARAGGSNPGHQLGSDLVAVLRRVDGVEVVQHGTERLEAGIDILARSPAGFSTNAELLVKQEVSAEVKEGSTAHALGSESAGSGGSGRCDQGSYSESRVELLSVGCAE